MYLHFMDPEQLRALRAVVDGGTFDAAARTLHVTPSAISQRIKSLETAVGRVLVQRTKPVRVTECDVDYHGTAPSVKTSMSNPIM